MAEPTDFDLVPVPIGVFPLPFGYLLLPECAASATVRDGLLVGKLPVLWPPELHGHELAAADDYVGALAAFAGDDPVSRFNRYVLDPTGIDVDALRGDLGPQGVLLDIVRYTLGLTDDLPSKEGCSGELLALLLAAQGAEHAGMGDLPGAIACLTEAIDAAPESYPVLAGVLYGAVAHMLHEVGDLVPAVAALQQGTKLLADTDLPIACAEQHLELGTIFHEQADTRRDLLAKAVHHYHCALQTIDAASAPDLYAAAHANLGSAYLTMPMVEASDHLRHGVAVGSLRAALEVYQPETHPQQWASAQLNLANALIYSPSTHQGDNLVEAVELYEGVLATRNRNDDPLGYARVLANQGNALAHLGMFDHAWGKLVEARFIFEEFHEYDATHSVRGLLDEITRQRTHVGAQA